MSKKHRPIGFNSKPDDNEPDNDNQGIVIIGGPPANLEEVISGLFRPADNIREADELLSGLDLLDTVLQHCDVSKEDLFNQMIEMGFKTKSIDNQLYWLVNNN